MHDHVVGVRIVVPASESKGFARVMEVESGDALFHAARVSLGLLGVISKVGRYTLLVFILIIQLIKLLCSLWIEFFKFSVH